MSPVFLSYTSSEQLEGPDAIYKLPGSLQITNSSPSPPSPLELPEEKVFTPFNAPTLMVEGLMATPCVQAPGDALALAISNATSNHMNMTL
jgi:hypothetical protein